MKPLPNIREKKPRSTPQPASVIAIDGALLKLQTMAVISGESLSTLNRAIRSGDLQVVRRGARCTRIPAEAARAYLAKCRGVPE